MKSLIVLGLVASAAASAQAVELYNNGPVVDASGLSVRIAGVHGSFGARADASNVAADNFTVTGPGWNVESLSFFGYQTGAVGFSFTSATWSLRSGSDINTAAVIASGTTTVTNGGLVGFRVSSDAPSATNREIYRLDADIADITLAPGDYFVAWQLASTAGVVVETPPVLGSLGTGNSMRCLITVLPAGCSSFFANVDIRSLEGYDLPYAIQGSLVPEPGSWALMLAGGLGMAGLARRRLAG